MVVSNPKDYITAAGPNMDVIQNELVAIYADMVLGLWSGSGLDAVQAMAMPVAMMQQAVEAMATVKSIGETEKDAEMRNLIITILSAVFAVVPFIGEAGAAALGLETLARIISLAGDLANAGLSMYTTVLEPESAPMAIFGMLAGVGALAREPENVAKIATLRRLMSGDDVAKLGTLFVDQSAMIQKIAKVCLI